MNGKITSIVIHTDSSLPCSVRVKMDNGDVGYFELKKPVSQFYWEILKQLERIAQEYIDSKHIFGAEYAKRQRNESTARWDELMRKEPHKPEEQKRVVLVHADEKEEPVDNTDGVVSFQSDAASEETNPNEHADDNSTTPDELKK